MVMTAGERGGSVTEAWSVDGDRYERDGAGDQRSRGRIGVIGDGAGGRGWGLVAYTGRAREGQTGCEATEWESDTR